MKIPVIYQKMKFQLIFHCDQLMKIFKNICFTFGLKFKDFLIKFRTTFLKISQKIY